MSSRLQRAIESKPLRFTSLLVHLVQLKGAQAKGAGDFIRMSQELTAKITRTAKHISSLRPGAQRARIVHKMIDDVRKKSEKTHPERAAKVSCHKGCANCCHMFVTCTNDETALLVEVIVKKKIEIDMDLLRAQKDRDEGDYVRLGYEKARCVLLGPDNVCQVYEDRPTACRNLRVFTPPEKCIPSLATDTNIQVDCSPLAEVIASAAMNLDNDDDDDKIASVATKLWRYFEHQGTERIYSAVKEGQ